MNFFLYPSKDTTLYKLKKHRLLNAGSDEVIELSNIHDEAVGHDLSRILMQFDLSGINSVKEKLTSAKYVLNLRLMTSSELMPLDKINVYPLTKPWVEGNGRFVPSSDAKYFSPGANWKYTDGEDTMWEQGSHRDSTGGGGWYDKELCLDISTAPTDIDCSFQFVKNFSDVKVDITKIVNYWLEGSIPNYGVIIKFSQESEEDSGNVKFYSSDTNTIYYPYLQVSYDDYFFNPCQKRKVRKLVCPTPAVGKVTLPTPTPSHHMCPESGTIESGSLFSGTIESGSLFSGTIELGSLFSGTIESGSLSFDSLDPHNLFSGTLESGSLVSGTITEITTTDNDTTDALLGVVITNCLSSVSEKDVPPYSIEVVELEPNLNQVDEDIVPHIKRVKKEYRTLSRQRISVGVRTKHPTKTFSSKSSYDLNNYTLHTMKYSVRDAETDEVIVDFDEYSRISCDASGHYFNFDFTCLPVGRIYKFLILVESDEGDVVHEDKRRFIVRS